MPIWHNAYLGQHRLEIIFNHGYVNLYVALVLNCVDCFQRLHRLGKARQRVDAVAYDLQVRGEMNKLKKARQYYGPQKLLTSVLITIEHFS